jgi:hypothetical protein
LLEKLEVSSLALATVALTLAIWDRIRAPFWDRICPLGVQFDPELISWEHPEPTVRFRVTVKNRVDYRTQVLIGAVETWDRPSPESFDGPILAEELQDQIDSASLGSTAGPRQLIAEVEAFQRRHLVLVVRLRPGTMGILSPGATFLVGQRGRPRRNYRGRRRSVEVNWEGTRPVFTEVPRPPGLNS